MACYSQGERIDEEDAEGAADDPGDSQEVQERSPADEYGDNEALQGVQGQSFGRMPSDIVADAGVFRAVRYVEWHGGASADIVFVDVRPFYARHDIHDSDTWFSVADTPVDVDDDRHDGFAAEADTLGGGSGAAENDDDDAYSYVGDALRSPFRFDVVLDGEPVYKHCATFG